MNLRPKNIALVLMVAVAASGAALALAACGSGGSATAAPENVSDNGGSTEIATASFPAGHDTDEVSPTGAEPSNPCGLVSKAKAEAILGSGVKVSLRPQGPTCVYSGSGREIDVVIEKVPLGSLKNGAKKVEPVTIGSRRGYCITFQSTSLVVGLGSGRVLQVTGPCQAGVRFAQVALKSL